MKKKCTKCNIVKDLSEFYTEQSWCKECYKVHYKENKNRILKQHKEYCNKNKKKQSEWGKKYYKVNREKHLKVCKEYNETNKRCLVKYRKKYESENKDRIKQYKKEYCNKNKAKIAKRKKEYLKTENGKLANARARHNRRVHYKKEHADMSPTRWNRILQSQGNKCNICHKQFTAKRPPTQDHIVPLSKGGGLKSDNIQALCHSCNSSKHAKLDNGYIQTWSLI